jgi:hypothetical protein
MLDGDDLRRFNRLLLEDAYPDLLKQVYRLRMACIVRKLHETPRAALCLSGGGIRSGTFSLGVLQGFARRGLLAGFHYLSTVSGGGYIGAWMTAWQYRHPAGLDGLVDELSRPTDLKIEPEPEPLRHLREYSNFVAPQPSLASADVWSFAAIYVRNLLINWAALIPLLLSVLLLPRLVIALLYLPEDVGVAWWVMGLLLGGGFACSVLAVFYTTINRPSRADALPPGSWWRQRRGQGSFLRYSLLPTVMAGLCLSTFWAWHRGGRATQPDPTACPWVFMVWRWVSTLADWRPPYGLGILLVAIGVAIYVSALVLALIFVLHRRPHFSDLTAVLSTGVGGGLLTWLLVTTVFPDPAVIRPALRLTAALYGCLAVPAYLLVFFCAAAVFVAATSKRRGDAWMGETDWTQTFAIEDEDREWLGRHGGWLFIMALTWLVGSGLVVFGPALLLASPSLLAACGGVSGVVAVLGGKSALTAANDKNRASPGWKTLLVENGLTLAAMLFLAIVVAALSLLSSWGLARLISAPLPLAAWETFPVSWAAGKGAGLIAVLYYSPAWKVAGLVVLTAALGLIAGLLINLNKFSLHGAYRARIIRAFLGASRTAAERVPNPFTGFDPQDNIQMHELWPGLLREASFKPGGFAGFVVKLREHTDKTSKDLFDVLSRSTKALLESHRGKNPPSQSLKRSLLEDVNRLLDGETGLVGLASFADRAIDPVTREVLVDLVKTSTDPELVKSLEVAAGNNRDLGTLLVGRRGLLLALNRTVLDSVYSAEIVRIRRAPPPYRLLHVIGTALNLAGGKRLDWQQRRAESFTISPLHCGSFYRGYRRSRIYGGPDGISLGTAVTISGAAVSSNMGYHSSSGAVSLALTLFNARLGWWLGNPGAAGSERRHTARRTAAPYRRAFPRMSLAPLAVEAFGLTDDTSRYVLLSDGGHFDNLGLYEMVLRRCRFIVVVDGSQDEKAVFDDLGAAIRKVRIDLGIEITFEKPFQIYPKGHPNPRAGKYCAVATIGYADIDGCPSSSNGVLLYIKPALRGDEPRDVVQYGDTNTAFPHQSTLDQLFDESQFESYRALGSHIVDALWGPDASPNGSTPQTFATLMAHIYDSHLAAGADGPTDRTLRNAIVGRLQGL